MKVKIILKVDDHEESGKTFEEMKKEACEIFEKDPNIKLVDIYEVEN